MGGSGLPLCSLPALGWQPPRAAGIRCRPLPPDEPERKRDKVSPSGDACWCRWPSVRR